MFLLFQSLSYFSANACLLWYDGNVIVLNTILDTSRRVCREVMLTLAHHTLDSLDVLALGLIVEHVCHEKISIHLENDVKLTHKEEILIENACFTSDVLGRDSFTARTRVNADHGSANRPWRVANCHLQEELVGLDVLTVDQLQEDLHQRVQNVIGKRLETQIY